MRLMVTVGSCRGSPEMVDVAETTTEVRVVFSDEKSGDSLGCVQALDVRLQEPLGDRVLMTTAPETGGMRGK